MRFVQTIFRLIIFMLLLGDVQLVWAQNEAITEPTLFYRRRMQLGANINSAQLGGLNFKYGWHKTGTVKNILDIELNRIRHPKETRIYGRADNPRQYTYGRTNMAFFLRTQFGQNIFITDRPYKNATSLHFNYSIGITTALLKPIYIDVIKEIPDKPGSVYLATERYDPTGAHADQNSIYGNASFTDGLDEISAYFGAGGKASLSVEWGAYPDEFKSIEAGFAIDVFQKPLPLMAPKIYDNKQVFFTLFLGFSFGFNK